MKSTAVTPSEIIHNFLLHSVILLCKMRTETEVMLDMAEGYIINTDLANTIILADEKTTLDRHVINLFSHKAVLAPLLKYCVSEFSSFSPEYIMQNCFVGEPLVRKIAVHRDEPDAPGAPQFPPVEFEGLEEELLDGNERIQAMNSEDKTQREGTTIYDIIFQAKVPETEALIRLIINIEIQNDEKLKYSVVTRGIYYCARMISAQKNRIFRKSEYEKIQKVYSIWICPYAKNRENTVASYDIRQTIHEGDVNIPKADYDKLETIVITLNAEGVNSRNELIRYLSLLLSREMPIQERQQQLEEDYHLQMTENIRKDVNTVCNYSDAIENIGIRKGMQQGIQQGMQQGMQQGSYQARREALKSLMENLHFTPVQAMDALSIPADDRPEYLKYLSQ